MKLRERLPLMLVDDDPHTRETLTDILTDWGYEIQAFAKGAEAVQIFAQKPLDVLLVDSQLPDITGLEVLQKVREINPDAAVVIMTGYASLENAVRAMNQGATAYVMKPINHEELQVILKKAFREVRLSQENKRLIDRLQLTNRHLDTTKRELEKTNKELEQFASIVSHDLKAPLRGIGMIAHWLEKDHGEALGENGKEQIHLLIGRVRRMHDLIDGILRYSRIGRERQEKESVDLNQVLCDVIDLISPHQSISIRKTGTFPILTCEKIKLMQVFQNLISNAVKYMNKPQGEIRVGCEENQNSWKFYIEDNGPGIEEKYFDKIFQIFQTLSTTDRSESTGIGLALVKKIVEGEGGRIWLTSKVGEGATFFFTIPKKGDL